MKQFNIKSQLSRTIQHCASVSHKAVYSMAGFLLLSTIIGGLVLSSATTHADTSKTSSVSVTVNTACTITTGGGTYSQTIDPGTYEEITGSGINVSCNDTGGYALYAIGFSGG